MKLTLFKFIFIILVTSSTLVAQNLFMGEVNDESTIELLKSNTKRINESNKMSNRAKTEQSLTLLFANIEEKKEVIQDLEEQLSSTDDIQVQETLVARLEKEKLNYKQLQKSLVQLSVGSIDVKDLQIGEKKEKVSFDKSVDDIFEPFAIMLMRFTEVPREIEQTNLEIQAVNQKILKLDTAVKNLNSYKTLSSSLQFKIDQLAGDYAQKRLILLHKQNSLLAQLEKLKKSQDEPVEELFKSVWEFLNTHGLSVVLALLTFLLTNGILYLLKSLFERFINSKTRSKNEIFIYRLSGIIFSSLSFVIATSLALAVIYARSDWLVFALALFILFMALWSLKNALPQYFQEMLMILNIGVIREDEQTVYKGIPYIVDKISYHATLRNPFLSNAKIRLSLNELEKLNSRELFETETLFPTRVSDYVLIEKSYGKIRFQSPRYVELETLGAAIKTYETTNFLKLNPVNLSKNGFTVILAIAIDHKHKNNASNNIVQMLEKGLNRALSEEEFFPHLNKLWVNYSETTLNTLELKVLASFEGEAAEFYYYIDRTIRARVLEESNKNGWKIPHNILEINQL